MTWRRRGTVKRQQALAQQDARAVTLAIDERHIDDESWWGRDYNCGDRCSLCVPDWRERDEKMRQLDREKPTFTFAERVLAQVGLVLRQLPRQS